MLPDRHPISEPVETALRRFASDRDLSPHQQLVLVLMAHGLPYSEIAAERKITEQTVKEQASEILHLLGLRSRTAIEAAVHAAERRAAEGADAEELYVFLQLRFE